MRFERVLEIYKENYFKNIDNTHQKSHLEEVLERYKKSISVKGLSDRIKEENQAKINSNDLIEDLQIYLENGEFYVMDGKSSFEISVNLSNNIKSPPKIRFVEIFSPENRHNFYIIPCKNRRGKYSFRTENLALNSGKYRFSVGIGGEEIISNLNLEVLNGNLDPPKNSIFVERNNEESYFPDGDFLKLNPTTQKIKEGVIIFEYRTILRRVNKAYLYRGGKFERSISNEDKWCLIPENYEK